MSGEGLRFTVALLQLVSGIAAVLPIALLICTVVVLGEPLKNKLILNASYTGYTSEVISEAVLLEYKSLRATT
jgi:hypothetical protein